MNIGQTISRFLGITYYKTIYSKDGLQLPIKISKKRRRPAGKSSLAAASDANMDLILGSANGTYGSASAALNAGIGIDYVLAIASGDSGNGALSLAAAAGNALIANFICHVEYTSFVFYKFIVPQSPKKSMKK